MLLRTDFVLRVVAAVSSLVLSCAASAAPAVQQAPLNVVFVNPGKSGDAFWDTLSESMLTAAGRLNMQVEILTAERNYKTMQALALEVAARPVRPDYLVLVNDDVAARPALEAADAAGIRTLMIVNDITGPDRKRLFGPRVVLKNWIGSLVPDMEAAGARMARHLVIGGRVRKLHAADGKLHMLVLGGEEKTPTTAERLRGLRRVFEREGDVVIDRVLYANWTAQDAEDLTRKYLAWSQRRGVKVAGVWAANDPMALGAIKGITDSGLTPGEDILVAGLNWSREGVDRVKDGAMLLTDGGHFLLGAWSMIMLRDYHDGCDAFSLGETDILPTAAVTRAEAGLFKDMLAKNDFARLDATKLRALQQGRCQHYDFALRNVLRAIDRDSAE